jgi:hypothetical protein
MRWLQAIASHPALDLSDHIALRYAVAFDCLHKS